ncbi:MAG: hypothetical protein KC912_05255 [Proteobacteria bacterium]|nr:hypothetical protein [Pseudomonadota bacterium]
MIITLETLQPMLIGSGAVVLAGLGWQGLRYKIPPELVAIIATFGLPIAGIWRPSLLAYTLSPEIWVYLAGLLMVSILALRSIPMRSTRDVFLLGAIAGGLPAALMAARSAPDARTAGRLAAVAAGGAAMSPLGGPVQFLLPSAGLDWWIPSATAGAVAAAVCWRNAPLEPAEEPMPIAIRWRWLIAVAWAGCVLQMAGAPWALSALTAAPPKVPDAAWAAIAWSGGHFVDPWILADAGARARQLGADGSGFEAAVSALTAPSFLPLIIAWSVKDYRAVLAGGPAILLALIALLVTV